MAKAEFYTLKEMEKKLRVSERTLFRYMKDGYLKGSQARGKWFFTDKDISDFLKRGRVETKSKGRKSRR